MARYILNTLGLRLGRGQRLPYPVSVRRRYTEAKEMQPGWGPETFDRQGALDINQARLAHLESLGLPIAGKTVLDVGSGVGHLAQFFVSKGCRVICLDGRPENIARLRELYPNLEAYVANVETEPLERFGTFDIVFAYGLLYHLENPLAALRNMASACRELLLLETMVCDHHLPVMRIEDEVPAYDQALKGLGHRPSPSYVVLALNRVGFPFVYAAKKPPEHIDFQFRWKSNLDLWRDGHTLRCIFIASRAALHNPNLSSLLQR